MPRFFSTTEGRQCLGTCVGVFVGALLITLTAAPSRTSRHTYVPLPAASVEAGDSVQAGLFRRQSLAKQQCPVCPEASNQCPVCPEAPQRAGAKAYVSGREAVLRLYEPSGHQHLAVKDLDPEKLAPLAQEAQEYIYRHQHPEDCSKVKFLVSLGHTKGNGIGSIMHVSGSHLSGALESGRVFIWGEKTGLEWTDQNTCPGFQNFECHFRPPSSCTLADVKQENMIIAELHYGAAGVPGNHVPTVFQKKLNELYPGMTKDEMKYWWRGQSVAYLMRFQDATIETVRKMRYDMTMHVVSSPYPSVSAALATVPFPPGTIHAHVRHGDKYTEMKLQPTDRYFNASEDLVKNYPMALRRIMFLSTEDPKVLQESVRYNGTWSILYTNIPRSNAGPLAQVVNLGADRAGYTARTHLLQLLMSLESDAWVTTRGSNWNRLIDELRCIWVDKCQRQLAEVGTPESWKGYDW